MLETSHIAEINSLKKELELKSPLSSEDNKRLKKKMRLEFNYNSNHLEGNTLTYGQTELLLIFDKSTGDVKVSDIEEMKAHDAAFLMVEEMAYDVERPLTETFICELNKLILVKPFWKDAIDYNGNQTRKKIEIGKYKSTPNSVRLRNGEIHEYASVESTPGLMTDLLDWYRQHQESMHPAQLAALFHYKLVCIHPFDDGNGRVARLIMNYIFLKNGYPPVIIKSVDKENYLTALQKADTGNQLAIIEYIEKQVIWSLELSIKAANGEDIEEPADIEKEIELLKRRVLSKTKIYKTLETSYKLVNDINENAWNPMSKTLSKFDDFFISNDNVISLNGKRYTGKSFGMKDDGNLSGNETFGCQWTKTLNFLKTSEEKIDFRISLNLVLKHANYNLELLFSIDFKDSNVNESILTISNEYNNIISSEIIANMQTLVSRKLIDTINQLGDN